MAQAHGEAVVRYQRAFDEAARRAPAEYWIWDGVHPTYRGHQVMADEWVRTVREFWPEPRGDWRGTADLRPCALASGSDLPSGVETGATGYGGKW